MKVDLIALDVDGTLLNDDYELTDETKQVIRELHEGGSRIVLCTGRSPLNAIPVMEQLGLEGYLIAHNGAATIHSVTRTMIHHYPFEVRALAPFVDYCRQERLHFDVCTPFELLLESWDEEKKEMYAKYMLYPTKMEDIYQLSEPVVKFTVYDADIALIDEVENKWKRMAEDAFHITRGGDFFVDMMDRQATKGNALRHLADYLGVQRERVLAIGNYFNDVEMLRFAGTGIAMGNAPEGVKEAADDVTLSNNENGVSAALRKYCFS
ncbi:Cof-type HAD-IIB family hydrolase [Paenibacillus sp. y28]|uniref:Cof-type HAD-IIB family hydrolase n=1 Tax=Paenibacillus sp. y28 TaxID=3129110 RepID=UPI0030190021